MARVVICAMLMGMALPAAAGTVETPREGFVYFRGQIVPGDALRLARALRTKPYNGAVTLLLDSIGGDYDAGLAMADVVIRRKRQVAVIAVVPWGWECSSSCVSVFAAATRREIGSAGTDKQGAFWHEGAIWVHSTASVINGQKVIDRESIATTWAWTRMLKHLGVPSVVTDQIIATTSRQGIKLDGDSLRVWGVSFRKP